MVLIPMEVGLAKWMWLLKEVGVAGGYGEGIEKICRLLDHDVSDVTAIGS